MTQAAVPAYLGTNFDSAPPGHRFTLYLEAWRDGFTPDQKGSTLENKTQTIKKALPLPPDLAKVLDALRDRQKALALSHQAQVFDSIATAPFATGLGMDHPLENGFAFLNPYGLPYLPGTGVKGVLRAAARELLSNQWLDDQGQRNPRGWTSASYITQLFGGEPGKEPFVRGALTFWDVIPTLPGNKMRVDVMTPHQAHYYQIDKKKYPTLPHHATPHDSGQPIPIPFLTVPPGAEFRFIVTCEEKYLADDALKGQGWKALLLSAFDHAYKWLGFGAKTAVGYGAMQEDPAVRERRRKADEERAQREAAEGADRAEAAAQQARIAKEAARQAAIKASFEALSEAGKLLHVAREKLEVAARLPEISRASAAQALQTAIKPIAEGAATWAAENERKDAAKLLEQSYNLIGWFVKGVDKDKRKKQESKKRELIATILRGAGSGA